jgi:hypothetical protein
VASYDSHGCGGGIRPRPQVKVKVTLQPTVSRPVCMVTSTHLGLTTIFCYCQTVAGLLMWGAFSDERMGLPFTIAAGPREWSHSWVRVPRNSWPYFTVSDSRRPQPGGPGPRIYIPQKQGGLVMLPGTGFPFRRLLQQYVLIWTAAYIVQRYRRKCLLLACNNDLISKSLQLPLAYPWTRLFNTQRWFLCKNRNSAETCLPIRLVETVYCKPNTHYGVKLCVFMVWKLTPPYTEVEEASYSKVIRRGLWK